MWLLDYNEETYPAHRIMPDMFHGSNKPQFGYIA